MDDKTIRNRLTELAETVTALPRAQPSNVIVGAYSAHAAPASRSTDELLDFLRLQMKYLLFDLEATKRENRYLRQMLERKPNLGEGADGF